MKRTKSVDDYIDGCEYWQDELIRLRQILEASELAEDVKWGGPCYTYDGKNVVGIGAFKSYFGLWFYQGALLADRDGVLINAQQGKTKALRQWRMHAANDIRPAVIRRYVREATALAREGKTIKPARAKKLVVPAELDAALGADRAAGDAFRNLRAGQRREYADYIAEAKREDTKKRRIEKILPMITLGHGLNDRYR